MATQCRAAYRSVLREFVKSSVAPRATRNREITRAVRSIVVERRSSSPEDTQKLLRDMGNMATLLRAQRIHKELLDRYNPLHDMTQEERIRATARRVGLDTPIEAKPDKDES